MECRRWLAAHDAASGIAQDGRIKAWLLRLLGGLPGDYSPEVVQMKMGAFVFALNDKPAYCFDDATLRIAVRRFKFWPSSAELIAFAEEMEGWSRRTAARAYKILDAAHKPPAPKAPAVDVDESIRRHREKQARQRRELAAIVEAKYGAMPAIPERGPGESDELFLARLKEWRNGPRLPLPEAETAGQETAP